VTHPVIFVRQKLNDLQTSYKIKDFAVNRAALGEFAGSELKKSTRIGPSTNF
jgi:hypothetical protein